MSQDAGFPPGITAGDLGRRVLASVIDSVLLVLVSAGAAAAFTLIPRTDLRIVLGIVAGLIWLAWVALLVWSQAIRGASPGMRVMRLEVVAVENGQPIGWARAIIRLLIFGALSGTVVGLIVMLVLLATHPRRQGWHDLAARAVVINARESAPAAVELPRSGQHASPERAGGAGTVGLPPTLSGASASSAGSANAPVTGPGASSSAADSYQQGQFHQGQSPQGQFQQGTYQQSPYPQGQQVQEAQGQYQQSSYQQAPHNAPQQQVQQQQAPQGIATPSGPGSADPAATSAQNPFYAGGAPQDEGPIDSTRLVPRAGGHQRRPDQGWAVVLTDGRQVDVESMILIGRNPQPRVGEESAELVSIVDQSRTVSKTHIAVGVDPKGIWVMDRGSTNGSAIATSAGTFEPCAAGERVRVREGQVVSFGDQRLEIRRSYPS